MPDVIPHYYDYYLYNLIDSNLLNNIFVVLFYLKFRWNFQLNFFLVLNLQGEKHLTVVSFYFFCSSRDCIARCGAYKIFLFLFSCHKYTHSIVKLFLFLALDRHTESFIKSGDKE